MKTPSLLRKGAAATIRARRWMNPRAGWFVRPLSESEKQLLPDALARQFDVGAVRIVNRFHTPLAAFANVTVVRGARIFWGAAPGETVSLQSRAHLVHELVHCWQYKARRRSGISLLLERTYRYALDPVRRFDDYGAEQQAAIVEDEFRIRHGAPPRWAVGEAATLDEYRKVIATAAAGPPLTA